MAAAHEEFLRAVSHDLRAPLRHITSYGPLVTEVLQEADGALPTGQALQEALEFLATMEQSARRMGRMLDALLALSRVARAPLHPQQLSRAEVADLIAQVQDALAPRAAGRAVQWQLTLAERPVRADAALLRQLLTELLDNALKFTRGREPAHIAITLAVESPGASDATGAGDARTQGDPASAGSPGAPDSQGSAGGQVTLHVQDNGAGFAPAQSAGLFGVFQRLHRESEFDGVGAGLAVVRAIAQRHGGQVSATATPGQGCTVCVTWPEKCS
ncbi:MAG: two-component sensor histidine kinase [Giesbergeria sp.]|nr:two-component sensor histidine kinase [Giesbergeria sp.]